MRTVRVMSLPTPPLPNSSGPTTADILRLAAPAKINLHLRVGPLAADGFHPLLSWMCTVGLFDTLTFSCSPAVPPGTVSLQCDDPALPCDASNLILRTGMW